MKCNIASSIMHRYNWYIKVRLYEEVDTAAWKSSTGRTGTLPSNEGILHPFPFSFGSKRGAPYAAWSSASIRSMLSIFRSRSAAARRSASATARALPKMQVMRYALIETSQQTYLPGCLLCLARQSAEDSVQDPQAFFFCDAWAA